MFRNGGKAEGITSGLDTPKRGLVDGPGGYAGENYAELYKKAQEVTSQIYPEQPTNINPFLMNFGLDLMSRSPQGGFLATAASAAKQPTQQLFKDIEANKQRRRDTELSLFSTMAEADAAGASVRSIKGQNVDRVLNSVEDLRNNYKTYTKTPTENGFDQLQGQIADMEKIAKGLINFQVDMTNFQGEAELNRLSDIKTELTIKGTPQDEIRQKAEQQFELEKLAHKYKVLTGQELVQKMIAKAEQAEEEEEEVEEKAMGGRIGYANAGPVMPQQPMMQQPTMAQAPGTMEQGDSETLSYDELRERLPSEITDDVVRLIAVSPEALEDFAVIQTQQDVNNFNSKYGVQLTLPPEA
tara:strand:- start:145 stop:1209 length:1065 start_codon:yes stop_codon:yes gene_type:complete